MTAHFLHEFYVGCDLVERDVARTFNNDLQTLFVGFIGQFGVDDEFLDLGTVSCIVNCTCPHSISCGEYNFVFLEDFNEVIKVGKEWVFLFVVEHPGSHEGPSTGTETAVPAVGFEPIHSDIVDPCMDCHEVGPELCLVFGRLEEFVFSHMNN